MTYKEAVQQTMTEYAENPRFQLNGRPLTSTEAGMVMDFLGMFLADVNFKLIESEKEKS